MAPGKYRKGSKRLDILADEEEADRWRKLAKKKGKTLSGLVRDLLRDEEEKEDE